MELQSSSASPPNKLKKKLTVGTQKKSPQTKVKKISTLSAKTKVAKGEAGTKTKGKRKKSVESAVPAKRFKLVFVYKKNLNQSGRKTAKVPSKKIIKTKKIHSPETVSPNYQTNLAATLAHLPLLKAKSSGLKQKSKPLKSTKTLKPTLKIPLKTKKVDSEKTVRKVQKLKVKKNLTPEPSQELKPEDKLKSSTEIRPIDDKKYWQPAVLLTKLAHQEESVNNINVLPPKIDLHDKKVRFAKKPTVVFLDTKTSVEQEMPCDSKDGLITAQTSLQNLVEQTESLTSILETSCQSSDLIGNSDVSEVAEGNQNLIVKRKYQKSVIPESGLTRVIASRKNVIVKSNSRISSQTSKMTPGRLKLGVKKRAQKIQTSMSDVENVIEPFKTEVVSPTPQISSENFVENEDNKKPEMAWGEKKPGRKKRARKFQSPESDLNNIAAIPEVSSQSLGENEDCRTPIASSEKRKQGVKRKAQNSQSPDLDLMSTPVLQKTEIVYSTPQSSSQCVGEKEDSQPCEATSEKRKRGVKRKAQQLPSPPKTEVNSTPKLPTQDENEEVDMLEVTCEKQKLGVQNKARKLPGPKLDQQSITVSEESETVNLTSQTSCEYLNDNTDTLTVIEPSRRKHKQVKICSCCNEKLSSTGETSEKRKGIKKKAQKSPNPGLDVISVTVSGKTEVNPKIRKDSPKHVTPREKETNLNIEDGETNILGGLPEDQDPAGPSSSLEFLKNEEVSIIDQEPVLRPYEEVANIDDCCDSMSFSCLNTISNQKKMAKFQQELAILQNNMKAMKAMNAQTVELCRKVSDLVETLSSRKSSGGSV